MAALGHRLTQDEVVECPMEIGLQSPPSSIPVPTSPSRRIHRKQKKPPPITPRSFNRFFTPRSSLNTRSSVRTSRTALEEITSSALNASKSSTEKGESLFGGALIRNEASFEIQSSPPLERKRKLSMSSMVSSSQCSTPARRLRVSFPDSSPVIDVFEDAPYSSPLRARSNYERAPLVHRRPIEPIRKSSVLTKLGGLTLRSVAARARTTLTAEMGYDWQSETGSFYSDAESSHACVSHSNANTHALPFCSASCNTNSLVAIGDEEGGIRLLETAADDGVGFAPAFLTWRPHTNAIMDMSFSSDDSLLATASGDQTALVIDMQTRKTLMCLSNHSASVKEVHFQPGSNDNVIATCSRDGTVSLWDLRCKGAERPSLQLRCSLESDTDAPAPQQGLKYPPISNCIRNAHKPLGEAEKPRASHDTEATTSRKNPPRVHEVSVTSMTFLPAGREHFLVTGSECNASVKLWDIRANYNHRIRRARPLATTQEPHSHRKHRHFGLTSLTTNSDGSRLYTVCRDSTVYAYSTSHLILGHSSEMSSSTSNTRVSVAGQDKEGLGPIYGFRHPRLQVATFYIKAAVRKPYMGKNEMLAVGSSNSCPILFPTDEDVLRGSNSTPRNNEFGSIAPPIFTPATETSAFDSTPKTGSRPSLHRSASSMSRSIRRLDNIPIYEQGTALIEGHKKEVSSVTWTNQGDLVTVSDDYHARCWRQDETGAEARRLRLAGNESGERWRCGWADVEDQYDDDDEGDLL